MLIIISVNVRAMAKCIYRTQYNEDGATERVRALLVYIGKNLFFKSFI